MKTITTPFFAIFSVIFLVASVRTEARDLTYKIGAGYQQIYTNGFVPKSGTSAGASQTLNGMVVSYGIARDILLEGKFAFDPNFDRFIGGPAVRYDFQRIFSRSGLIWNHLNVFTQAAFLVKGGDQVEMGITLHIPYVGVEIFPFSENNFAITTSAGVAVDFVEDSLIGFTGSQFGDVGVRLYF